jgi:hypothetical protein
MSPESIQPFDLEPILTTHPGNRALAQALQPIAEGEDLLRALGRYIHFNSTFGGGVANLAGEIAVRQDLFRDPEEAVEILADRSVDVAADIFFAAVDEFDDRATTHRDTHRTLAQATLKAAGAFFGYDTAGLNRVARPNEATLAAIRNVRDGYGVNQVMDAPKIFRAIGFHVSSEILADEEFRVLDGFLRAQHPELVTHLEQTVVAIGGVEHAAYFWIQIHTSVEADHFQSAVQGANRALRYYRGPESQAEVKGWILQGFQEFATVQAECMDRLTES